MYIAFSLRTSIKILAISDKRKNVEAIGKCILYSKPQVLTLTEFKYRFKTAEHLLAEYKIKRILM